MDTPASLRLLASTNNARGDLFTRLVKDLFFALGRPAALCFTTDSRVSFTKVFSVGLIASGLKSAGSNVVEENRGVWYFFQLNS